MEDSENINTRNKLFKRFKKIDKELYKKAQYNTLKLIIAKSEHFLMMNSQNILETQKKLWETLKSLGMPKKTLISNFYAVESNNALIFDKKAIAKMFKDFF